MSNPLDSQGRCSWEILYEAWVDSENSRDAAVKAERERCIEEISDAITSVAGNGATAMLSAFERAAHMLRTP